MKVVGVSQIKGVCHRKWAWPKKFAALSRRQFSFGNPSLQSLATPLRMNIITCFIATLLYRDLLLSLLTLLFILALHSRNRSTLAETSKHACAFTLGESFTPGGVTHTLGRNDRGVIHSSDNGV